MPLRLCGALALLVVLAYAGAAQPGAAPAPSSEVIKLPDGSAQLRVGDESVTLAPGMRGYKIPPETTVIVVSGRLWAMLLDSMVKAGPGDQFLFRVLDGRVQLVVAAGAVEIDKPDGTFRMLGPGDTYEVSAQPAAPPGVPPTSPAAGPQAPSTPPGWDPLSALARSMSALASFQKPQLRLVLELHPFYRVAQTYDSNIYLVPADKPDGSRVGGGVVGSWITSHEFGTRLLIPFNRRYKLEALYGLEWHSYFTQSRTNNAFNHKANLSYAYTGVREVTARAWEDYKNTQDPAFSELTARERRFENTLGASLDSRRSRWFAWTTDLQHRTHKYLNPSLAGVLNRYELLAGGSAGVLLQPKTRLYVAYHRLHIHYSAGRGSHSRSHLTDIGIEGRLSAKLSGKVQAGAQFREYAASLTPDAPGPKSATFLNTQVQLALRPGGRSEYTLRAFRDINESTFSINRYYIATGAALGAAHTYRRVTLTAHASAQIDRYPEAVTTAGLTRARRDDLYGLGGGVDMRVRTWLSWGLGYQRLQRHSIFTDQFNYSDNRTTTNLRIVF